MDDTQRQQVAQGGLLRDPEILDMSRRKVSIDIAASSYEDRLEALSEGAKRAKNWSSSLAEKG